MTSWADVRAFSKTLIAGSLAGVVADVATHPLSTVKTRLQVQGAAMGGKEIARYAGPLHALGSVASKEGVSALYKGLGITVAGAAPAQGLYFAGYDLFRAVLGRTDPATNFLAGNFAQLCGSLVWVPMDTIKERLQIEGQLARVAEPLGTSARALRLILRKEGVRGLYPAYWVHQATWAPFNGLFFALYEYVNEWTAQRRLPSWPSAIIAATIAGTVTNPMDVVKTRLQVVRASPHLFQYTGVFHCAASIAKTEGVRVFFDGAFARCLLQAPRLALALAVKDALQIHVFK